MRVTVALIALAIGGCGYKTPLVLPQPKPAAQQPASEPAPKKPAEK